MMEAIAVLMFLVLWFGLHGTACQMHMASIEDYWALGGNADCYKRSYIYCRLMSFPVRALTRS
jgi:hypothetical protein